MKFVPTYSLLDSLLTDATQAASGVAGPLHACFLGLYVAPTPLPSPARLIGDIVEATYTGYARQAVVWGAQHIGGDGLLCMDAASLEFLPSDAVTPNTITGYFLASLVTAGVLLGMAQFDAPIALPDHLHLLDLIAQFGFDPVADYGEGAVVS